jgi:hypothetical protein
MSTTWKLLRLISSELVLGSLVAILSVLTAIAAYQGNMADSDQSKYNVKGQQELTNANAEYLTANQLIVYDYNLYDGWYTADDAAKKEYYRSSYSEELQAAFAANQDDVFTDGYYAAMYADANAMFAKADEQYQLAEKFNERGDQLQLVMMIMALGLAFAAWASLLKDASKIRVVFAVLSILTLVYGLVLYFQVAVVTV